MAKYVRQEPSDSNTYHLTGVLMHVGAEASHGHYIAHIQVRGFKYFMTTYLQLILYRRLLPASGSSLVMLKLKNCKADIQDLALRVTH